MIRGALAAAVTPLRDGGERVDEDAIAPYLEFLVGGGMDGVFALGTTGEGILLGTDERRRAAELFLAAAEGRLPVAVHCGAQTTAETVALSEHAAGHGADGVAVVAPPYYQFDERGLAAHFGAAARACAPTPFYVYEFAARSGYPIPVSVVERLREDTPNLAGIKVSDAPFEAVRPYLLEGLDVFIGQEGLLPAGLGAGAAGTVSGLAAVFPEPVAALIRSPDEETVAVVRELRDGLQRAPFIAAAKRALGRRGVAVGEDVRAPLRALTGEERSDVDRTVSRWLESRSRDGPVVADRPPAARAYRRSPRSPTG